MGNKYHYKTFEEWCLENNRQDILELWDYDRNKVTPSDIPAGTKEKYYFKCPNRIHESELKRILNITDKPTHTIICKECNKSVSGKERTDLIGKQFGELIVIGYDIEKHNIGKYGYWICECSCGAIVSVATDKLKKGKKIICGKSGKHKNGNETSKGYLHSGREYRQFRKAVKEKTQNVCIISGEQLDDNEFHHIFPYAQYPELRYYVNNGACIAKKYHSTSCEGSFHRVYGTGENNTPENFQKYVNEKRRELGNYEYFDVYAYVYPYDEDNLEIGDNFEYLY